MDGDKTSSKLPSVRDLLSAPMGLQSEPAREKECFASALTFLNVSHGFINRGPAI